MKPIIWALVVIAVIQLGLILTRPEKDLTFTADPVIIEVEDVDIKLFPPRKPEGWK